MLSDALFIMLIHIKMRTVVGIFNINEHDKFYAPELSSKSFITLRPAHEVLKLFPCSTQLSMKFILLINVKMPTIVGILIIISVINATS